jgi:hypothetical protein
VAGERPALPTDVEAAPEGYNELMRICWDGDPASRPSFARVCETISTMQRTQAKSEIMRPGSTAFGHDVTTS